MGAVAHASSFWWHPYDESLGTGMHAAAQLLYGRDDGQARRAQARRAAARADRPQDAARRRQALAARPYPLSHACPGLRRKGMRLPVQARDLRPDLRARHARDAVLHRVPQAHRPPLRRGRRRRRRAREGRGPAGLRRRRDADRAGRDRAAARARRRGLDPAGMQREYETGDLEAHLHRDRRDERHRRQHQASTRTPSGARCS